MSCITGRGNTGTDLVAFLPSDRLAAGVDLRVPTGQAGPGRAGGERMDIPAIHLFHFDSYGGGGQDK